MTGEQDPPPPRATGRNDDDRLTCPLQPEPSTPLLQAIHKLTGAASDAADELQTATVPVNREVLFEYLKHLIMVCGVILVEESAVGKLGGICPPFMCEVIRWFGRSAATFILLYLLLQFVKETVIENSLHQLVRRVHGRFTDKVGE